MGDSGPGAFGWGSEQAEDALQLVLVGGSRKQRSTRVHLGHDATDGPDVDAGAVGTAAQQHVRSSVPERHHLVREGVDGDAECPRQTEVGELQLAILVYQEILGLEISMQDLALVAKGNAAEELVGERLGGRGIYLPSISSLRFHVFLQIHIHVLGDEHQLVLGVDHIMEGEDVFVL